MSMEIRADFSQLVMAAERIARLGKLDREALLEGIGAEIESQTHRRIRYEKTAPDGTPWPAWSARYAKTRHAGHSLLMNEGHLDDSIQSLIEGDAVYTGSNLPYAAIQNLGGVATEYTALDARTYLGFSSDNLDDISWLVNDFTEQHIQDTLQ